MEAIHKWGTKFTPCFIIPQRYLLCVMTSWAVFTSYTMRVAISIAITEMVVKKNESLSNDSDACPIMENATYVTVKHDLYDWNEMTQGLILTSFYWGYIGTHIPGALLAERMGGKHVLAFGVFLNAVLTIISPQVIFMTEGDPYVMICLRVLMGFGQGIVYPVATALLAQWAPPKEKGALSSIVYAGALLGTVLTNSASGALIKLTAHWAIVFYVFGILGLVWNLLWQLLCYSYPRTHPCLKQKEKEFLEKELAHDVAKHALKTPWKDILTSVPVWALIVAQFGHDWGWFTMVTDLPKYMNAVLRYDVQQNGFLSSLPYLLMWIATILFGYLADWLIAKNYLSVKATRMMFGTFGTMGPALFMVLASYVGCAREVAVAMFTLSLFLMGFYFVGIKVNALDLSPNFAGTIMGMVNGLGVFAGMLAPLLVGVLAPNQTLTEWRHVFWLSFVMFAVTNVIYVIFMSAEVQIWNFPPEEREERQ